jgi:hypothetical protein
VWNIKCFVIPPIIGTTGIVTKERKKSVNNTRKSFNRPFTKTNSCTRDITLNKESDSYNQIRSLSGGVHHWFKREVRGERKPVMINNNNNNNNINILNM